MPESGLSFGAGVGLPGNLPDTTLPQKAPPPAATSRPYVRLELLSSTVPGSAIDTNRWYRFAIGCALADILPGVDEQNASVLQALEDGTLFEEVGKGGALNHAMAQDAMTGQSANVSFYVTDIIKKILRLIRPMDRLRIVLVHPLVDRPKHEWLLFDGPLRSCHSALHAGDGFSYVLTLGAGGLPMVLGGAAFNWQCFVHPGDDLFPGQVGKTLYDMMKSSAIPAEIFVGKFLKSALYTAMGIKFGDWKNQDGISIENYVQVSPTEWKSVPNSAIAIAWPLLQSQSMHSFWSIIQSISEPYLHEIFCRYELIGTDTLETPVLVHRPLPFPGKSEYDQRWLALPVFTIGPNDPFPIGIDEEINTDGPNCVHWSGIGNGDHSEEAFMNKLYFGFVASKYLINRFGFHSVEASSKSAPIDPKQPIQDTITWTKDKLEHYGRQIIPTSLMRNRQISVPFLPVRPGTVLEDYSFGPSIDACVTGYITGTSFNLSGSSAGIQMKMDIQVERCVWGTDSALYPQKVRELVDDIELQPYSGPESQNGGFKPRVETSPANTSPQAPDGIKKDASVNKYRDAITYSANRFSLPKWLIAQILQCETSMGTYAGIINPAVRYPRGIAQIIDAAASDCVSAGLTNPDGSLFKLSDRGDPTNCINACAKYLTILQGLLNPGAQTNDYYSWLLRAYRFGAGATNIYGAANAWTLPGATDASLSDYSRYWSPAAVTAAKVKWGQL